MHAWGDLERAGRGAQRRDDGIKIGKRQEWDPPCMETEALGRL